jgi:hypothetical protein
MAETGGNQMGQSGCYTPPKFQALRTAEEKVVLLEHRLEEFVQWLQDRGNFLVDVNGIELGENQCKALIEEYVNS